MEQSKFDVWRKCWEAYLLGEQKNPEGDYEQQVIASVDRMAAKELDFRGYEDESECTVSSPIFGLRAKALAYRTRGSRFYRDPDELREVKDGLEDFYRTDYNMDLAPERTENWWLFEVGAPLRILDILVLLYDDLNEPEKWIQKFTDVILHFKDAYLRSSHGKPETGANLMWKCHILLLSGILRREQKWIDWANSRIPTLLGYSHAMQIPGMGKIYDDGFYPDGSFIQHYVFSYTGGYGKHFLSILAGDLFAFHGQDCLTLPRESLDFLFKMIREAYLPLLYKGHMMDLCRGREPSRYWCQDDAAGALVLRALLYLTGVLPQDQRKELEGWLKEQLALPETRKKLFYDFHPSAEYYATPSLADRLRALDASSTAMAAPLTGHYNFGVMCKPVHRTARYAFAVSMYSRNIACYEKLMKESNRFWHVSDGATYLYTGSGSGYCGDYYAAADMQRLAGTTVERSPQREDDPYYSWYLPEARNVYAFAGGATLGNAGIAGQQYRGQGKGKKRTLEIRKSWFMFENEIVCLGSGISSPTDNPVETIILNDRLLQEQEKGSFCILTGESGLRLTEGREMTVLTDRLFVSQVPDKTGNGYLFPGGAQVHILLAHRRGTWNSTKLNPDHISENTYLTVWISHGCQPSQAAYAYAILPACTEQEWQEAADRPSFTILENSVNAHAVKSLREGLLGINFWQEAPCICAGVECSTQASILLREEKATGETTLAVADPTKQDRQIALRILTEPEHATTIDTRNSDGGTTIIHFQKKPAARS
ncbi:MAG: polysaccharide lyase 8 family protein [Bilifractor sp.]|jgi:hyaluronate lyase